MHSIEQFTPATILFFTDPPASSLAHLPLLHLPEDVQTPHLALPPASCPSQSSFSVTVLPSLAGPPPPPISTPSFVLSKASAPIPGKLVAKVQSLQFIEMWELLPDNITLLERLAALLNTSALSHSQRHTPQREVSSLLTWVCAFTTHIAIMAEVRTDLIKCRLAYMHNTVTEASRFGGDGWKTYDYVFWSQAAVDKSMDWTELNPSMMMAFMPNHYATFAKKRIILPTAVPLLLWSPFHSRVSLPSSPAEVLHPLIPRSVSPGIKGPVCCQGHASINTHVAHVVTHTGHMTAL